MKLIHINESVFNRLLEDNRRPPFQDFYDSVVAFIDGIRRDPIGTVPNETLKGCGLHNGELRKKLYDYGIIRPAAVQCLYRPKFCLFYQEYGLLRVLTVDASVAKPSLPCPDMIGA